MSLLDVFRSTAGKMRSQLHSVRENLESARRRREELQTLPLPPEEISDILIAILDRRAAHYPRLLAVRTDFLQRRPLTNAESPALQQAAVMALSEASNTPSCVELEGVLMFLFRDQVCDGLRRAIKASMLERGVKCGAPRAERNVELAQLESKIADLDREEASMLAELAAVRRETEA